MQYDITISAIELDHDHYAVIIRDALTEQQLLKSPPLDAAQCARLLDRAVCSAKERGHKPLVRVCQRLAAEARSSLARLN